jgi:hypothetical protein
MNDRRLRTERAPRWRRLRSWIGVFRFSCGPKGELPRFVGVAATPQARRATAKRHSSAQGQAEASANLMRRALTLMVSTELTVGCYSEEWWLEGIGRVMKGTRGNSIVRSRTVLHICNPL